MENETKSKKCKIGIVALIVMALWLLGGLGFFLRVLDKVMSGHGLDSYTTFWGVQFNYLGALVVFIVGAVFIVLSPIVYWFSTKEERSFKRKYCIPDQKS